MRIALFVTCVNDTMFPATGRAVVTLLERLGHTVEFFQDQTCCGQMHFNTGYRPEAFQLADRFTRTFGECEAVVTPSASCAAMIRDHHPALTAELGGQALHDASAGLALRVFEFTEFLVDVLGVTDVGAVFPHPVAYHPTCHSLRSLRLGDRPFKLLRKVRGLDLVDLPQADSCCGFGGTFALKNSATSNAMLADKMSAIAGTGAEVLCAADNSCLMHIGGGLSRSNSAVRTMHLAEILASTEDAPR